MLIYHLNFTFSVWQGILFLLAFSFSVLIFVYAHFCLLCNLKWIFPKFLNCCFVVPIRTTNGIYVLFALYLFWNATKTKWDLDGNVECRMWSHSGYCKWQVRVLTKNSSIFKLRLQKCTMIMNYRCHSDDWSECVIGFCSL